MVRSGFMTICILFVVAGFVLAGGGEDDDAASVVVMEGYSSENIAGVNVQWMVEGEMLHIQAMTRFTGWVAVGFDPSRMMKGANIIIGYVENGEVFLRDDFGVANIQHDADTNNGGVSNLSDVEGEEVDGVTTIRFTIPLDSGDELDRVLTPGNTHKLLAAHGPDGADNFGTYHGSNSRGSAEITL